MHDQHTAYYHKQLKGSKVNELDIFVSTNIKEGATIAIGTSQKKELPFKDKSFDVVLLITVLHHTTYQKELLNEAKRLGKKVIVMEDVYTHYFGEKLLKFTDSLVNLEFKGHPHTNRTHEMWVLYFKKVNFEITTVKHIITAGYFRQVIYVLK